MQLINFRLRAALFLQSHTFRTATLNWNTKIMPLQALGDDGSGWTSRIVTAIRYAVDNGAQVINMSLGGGEIDPSMKAAIQYA